MKPLAERLSDRKLISHGDISSAYRARDTRLDRDVFLKVLHPHFAQDPDLRARFEREARAAAKLDHPQLVRIYEVGEDPNEGPFMILEWVEGETLAAKIIREGKLTPERVERLASSLLNALSVLHAHGILHRDVKPENILCRKDGEFKLTDFSLALLSDAPKLTHHTAVVGTPAYLAPELARGKSPSERSDLFAAGVVLFEASTGQNPFYAESLLESLRRVREVEPNWSLLAHLGEDTQLPSLIKICLEKESDARPESANDAVVLLTGGTRFSAASVSARSRARVFTVAALVLLIVGAVAYFAAVRKSEVPQVQTIPPVPDTTKISMDTSAVPDTEQADTSAFMSEPAPDNEAKPRFAEKRAEDSVTKPERKIEPEKTAAAEADSFSLSLDTTPWARITMDGNELGSTPLGAPLRLERGEHILMLRNPAFPPIQAKIELTEDSRVDLQLAAYVQHVELTVEPWGDVFLDNEMIGASPLNRLLAVLPGKHTLRVTHPTLQTVEKTWQAVAGDTIKFRADLTKSVLALRTSGEPN
ncbi:MAG: serine/threonine protein kinase [Calditrichaeota bacterium]|nr:serine/threonine protein kinase [Calditrichota bacterium]MCB9367697.1 serine/threonine protein kinase [Calditrichota bacterium]